MKLLFLDKVPFVNLGIMSISANLKHNGHECDLLIENAEDDLFKKIQEIKPDVIAFACTTGMHTWALETATKIKSMPALATIPILLGGSYPTFYPKALEHPSVDMICIGDGEEVIVELLDKMGRNENITSVESIHLKKDGKIYKNEVRELIQDLDILPYPDRHLYKRYPFVMKQDNYRVIVGRGCPYSCKYCYNKPMRDLFKGKGQYVRRRSNSHVIGELLQAKKELNIKRVDFLDDTFIYGYENFVKSFLREYGEKIHLPFSCCVTANLVTDEVAYELKKAGCHNVKMGIETANEFLNAEVLGRNQLTKQEIITAAKHFEKHKISLQTFTVLGIPGETIEDSLASLRFNIEIKTDFARVALLQPYPKTEIEQYAKDNGYLAKEFDLNSFENSYFINSPVLLKDKDQMINLKNLFNICVRFPFTYPLVRRLIRLPTNIVFETLFKLDYAYSIFKIDKVNIIDVITFGSKSKGFFTKKKLTYSLTPVKSEELPLPAN